MGSYSAPAAPGSLEHSSHSGPHLFGNGALINKRCLLLTMGSDGGTKTPTRKEKEKKPEVMCFVVVGDRRNCEQFQLQQNLGGKSQYLLFSL